MHAECAQQMMTCSECRAEIKRVNQESHARDDCPKRRVTCTTCQARHTFDTTESHKTTCPLMEEECKLCHHGVIRRNLQHHIDTVCPKKEVECKYAALTGCRVRLARDAIDEHYDNKGATQAHFDGLLKTVQDMTVRLAAVEKSEDKTTLLERRVLTLEGDVARVVQTQATMSREALELRVQALEKQVGHTGPFINKVPVKGSIAVGDVLDALDVQSIWYPVSVMEVNGNRIKIHYFGWADYDEVIDLDDLHAPQNPTRTQPPGVAPCARIAGAFTKSGMPKKDARMRLPDEIEPYLQASSTLIVGGGFLSCGCTTRSKACVRRQATV